jgi:hypothetical protein
MENYNLNAEIIDDINSQKTIFFKSIDKELILLVDIGLLDKKIIKNLEKKFMSIIIQNHLEIRSNINLTRYFILKKKEKLNKELKDKLYMTNIFNDLKEETKNEYWRFIHTIFLLLESVHNNKDDAIINTLTLELEKEIIVEEEIEKKIEDKIVNVNKKNKKNNFKPNKDILSGFDFSKLSDIISQISNNKGDEEFDISKMLKSFIPNMETSQNKDLMSELMTDIKDSLTNVENSDQIFDLTKKLGQKYQNMIAEGNIEPKEILGSLMGLMTDDSFSKELSKIDLSKLKPEDMLGKMMSEISPEILKNMTGGNDDLNLSSILSNMSGGSGDMNLSSILSNMSGGSGDMNLSSILSNIPNMALNQSSESKVETNQEPLTSEQIAEMEEFYANVNLNVD